MRLALIVLCALVIVAQAGSKPGVTYSVKFYKEYLSTDGVQSFPLNTTDSHPTLVTGEDSDSMFVEHRPRIAPQLTIDVNRGKIVAARIDYGEKAFAVPPGTITFSDWEKKIVFQQSLPELQALEDKSIELNLTENLRTSSEIPNILHVELGLVHQDVSTYVYSFEKGIPDDIFDSGVKFDLTPHNASMGVRFSVQVVKEPTTKLSVWVARRPSAPDFALLLFVDGKLYTQDNVDREPNSADGLGFDVNIAEDVEMFRRDRVDFVAHYYERHREVNAVAKIPNLRATLNRLRDAAVKQPTAVATEVVETDVRHLSLRFAYHPGTNMVAVWLLQATPIRDVQLTMSMVNAATGTRDVFFREGDDVVPYYHSHESDIQYGWDSILPVNVSDMIDDDGKDFFDGPAEIEVTYNQGREDEFRAGELLERWLESYGGHLNHLDLDFLDKKDHSYTVRHPVTSRAVLQEGEEVARIPYHTMVVYQRLEGNRWFEYLLSHSQSHREHVASQQIHGEATHVMLLAAMVTYVLESSYRPYFNTFTSSALKLPPFYSEAEVALFDFEPQIRVEIDRMKALWEVELRVLQDSKLPRTVSKDVYYRVRSQVEARMLNLTSGLALIPVVDLLTHDDSPNCAMEFNDEEAMLIVRATKKIHAKTPLTLDHGWQTRPDLDALLQFGFVPPKAIKSAMVPTPTGPMILTHDTETFTPIRRAYDEAEDGEGSASLKSQLATMLGKLAIDVPPSVDMDRHVADAAKALRQNAKEVLTEWSKKM